MEKSSCDAVPETNLGDRKGDLELELSPVGLGSWVFLLWHQATTGFRVSLGESLNGTVEAAAEGADR